MPYSTGGSNDEIARVLAEHRSGTLKQAVVIEIKVGASAVKTRLESIVVPRSSTAAYFKVLISQDLAKWTRVAQEASVQVD